MGSRPRKTGLVLIATLTLLLSLLFVISAYVGIAFLLTWTEYLWLLVATSFVAALLISWLILSSRPLLESMLERKSSVLALDNLNHPLLTKLQKEAPGTYHHSLAVANLAFQAAKAINVDATLARIGGYYHDVGKIKDPGQFIENIDPKKDPHNGMEPKESAQIIIKHIVDGIELAKKHELPEEVVHFIPEHTGTTLVYFFYVKARKKAKKGEEVYKRDFRYPGPKPMSKETALVMLADSVEAAVRAHGPSTDHQLRKTIDRVVAEKVDDTQLDISGMTKRDIEKTKEAFFTTLQRINHQRIKYPKRTLRKPSKKQSKASKLTSGTKRKRRPKKKQ